MTIIDQLKSAYAENPAKALNLLPELFRQADDGKIVELPCKVGDTVWTIRNDTNCIERGNIQQFIKYSLDIAANIRLESGRNSIISVAEFGRIIFLTRKAAEKALKESES